MVDAALARAIHVVAVVVWIGGVAMATTAVLPLIRRKGQPIEERFALFEAVEGRFVWQARIATVLVALSGFYMVERYELWSRFAWAEYWWMHAMVATWLVFTLLLFAIEPFLIHGWVRRRALTGDETVLTTLHWIHWILLMLSLVTVFAAVAGSHGAALAP